MSEKEAKDFSNKIHEFLKANRKGYNATHWSDVNKSEFDGKWWVKIPFDYQKWPIRLDIKEAQEKVIDEGIKIYLNTWKRGLI